ncbi:MAG: ABC transporter ATP-binding protein [Chlorobiaceae bacterium]|nr:ABC transporter ATP-binding protein [Chlorobiaceae bacterium]
MSRDRSNIGRLLRQASYIPKTLRLVWNASRGWMVAWLLLLVVQGVLPVITVNMTRQVVDSLALVVSHGSTPSISGSPAIVMQVLTLGLLMLFGQVLQSLGQWVRTIQGGRIQDYMGGLIHDRVTALDLGFFDSTSGYDRLHRARADAVSRPIGLLESMGSLGQNTITLAGMAALLSSYAYWVPLLLVAGTVPALWVTVRHAGRMEEWRRRNTTDERRCDYYDWLLTTREAAQELRFFDLGDHYRSSYQRLRATLRQGKRSLETGKLLTELVAGILAILTTGAGMLWMVSRTIAGRAGVGDIVLFYQAFGQGQRLMSNLLRNAGDIYLNMLFLENLFELLTTEPVIRDPEHPLPVPALVDGIRFESVDFRYPGSERLLLQGFDLMLRSGEIAAILGENGEGKTTLIKLLCRFYDPDRGRITIDGRDIRQLRQADWRRQITVLFQDPMRYHVSAAENIAHGDIRRTPEMMEIESAAEASGAAEIIRGLPEGFGTVLGKWFGGAELSAGEWQRVALARAFLRRAKLIILDEPTSMLDVWAESTWFERFRELAAGCTVLIISHRLATTMQADVIHVMQNGRIVESGSHRQLLEKGGRYQQAWESRQELSVL